MNFTAINGRKTNGKIKKAKKTDSGLEHAVNYYSNTKTTYSIYFDICNFT